MFKHARISIYLLFLAGAIFVFINDSFGWTPEFFTNLAKLAVAALLTALGSYSGVLLVDAVYTMSIFVSEDLDSKFGMDEHKLVEIFLCILVFVLLQVFVACFTGFQALGFAFFSITSGVLFEVLKTKEQKLQACVNFLTMFGTK